MKKIAVIAYWKWSFDVECSDYRDNYGEEGSFEFYQITKLSDIPKNIKFDDVVVCSHSENVMSWSDLQNLIEALK